MSDCGLKAFLKHYETLCTSKRNGNDDFDVEFQLIKQCFSNDKNMPRCLAGAKEVNKKKNRFKDILPYDLTRVLLPKVVLEDGSDYINANFIKGVIGDRAYIAAQGPLPTTVNDFWRMLWHFKTKVVIMACRLVENCKPRCEHYWGVDNEPTRFGDIKVVLAHERNFAENLVLRVLEASKGMEKHSVTQLHYTDWPDHGVPEDVELVIKMLDMARKKQPESDVSTPLVVHCSAGCGRTGAIIATDYARQLIQTRAEHISIFDLVMELRSQRPAMVQTKEQYEFLYNIVNEMVRSDLGKTDPDFMQSRSNYVNVPIPDKDDRQRDRVPEINRVVSVDSIALLDSPTQRKKQFLVQTEVSAGSFRRARSLHDSPTLARKYKGASTLDVTETTTSILPTDDAPSLPPKSPSSERRFPKQEQLSDPPIQAATEGLATKVVPRKPALPQRPLRQPRTSNAPVGAYANFDLANNNSTPQSRAPVIRDVPPLTDRSRNGSKSDSRVGDFVVSRPLGPAMPTVSSKPNDVSSSASSRKPVPLQLMHPPAAGMYEAAFTMEIGRASTPDIKKTDDEIFDLVSSLDDVALPSRRRDQVPGDHNSSSKHHQVFVVGNDLPPDNLPKRESISSASPVRIPDSVTVIVSQGKGKAPERDNAAQSSLKLRSKGDLQGDLLLDQHQSSRNAIGYRAESRDQTRSSRVESTTSEKASESYSRRCASSDDLLSVGQSGKVLEDNTLYAETKAALRPVVRQRSSDLLLDVKQSDVFVAESSLPETRSDLPKRSSSKEASKQWIPSLVTTKSGQPKPVGVVVPYAVTEVGIGARAVQAPNSSVVEKDRVDWKPAPPPQSVKPNRSRSIDQDVPPPLPERTPESFIIVNSYRKGSSMPDASASEKPFKPSDRLPIDPDSLTTKSPLQRQPSLENSLPGTDRGSWISSQMSKVKQLGVKPQKRNSSDELQPPSSSSVGKSGSIDRNKTPASRCSWNQPMAYGYRIKCKPSGPREPPADWPPM